VISLKRVRIGHLSLHGLSDGAWRFLQADEVTKLRELAREEKSDGGAAASGNAFAVRAPSSTRAPSGVARGTAKPMGVKPGPKSRGRPAGTSASSGSASSGSASSGSASMGGRGARGSVGKSGG